MFSLLENEIVWFGVDQGKRIHYVWQNDVLFDHSVFHK